MYISDNAWNKYISLLRRVNEKASSEMFEYLATHEWWTSRKAKEAAMDFAFGLATKYGEAAGAAASEFYDHVADEWAGHVTAPAVPAKTATYGEVAKAFNGTAKTLNHKMMSDAIGRLVKMAGVDTTMQNALRDGAEWAWIPRGDTCMFCLTLASRGWQEASAKAIRNGHAEHIHANCDCTYAVRFGPDQNVEGYDPKAYRELYYSAEGNTPEEKINSMRRMKYGMDKDRINAQKRAAYARRMSEQENSTKQRKALEQSTLINRRFIESNEFRDKIDSLTESITESRHIVEGAREILNHRDGTFFEDLVYADSKSKNRLINKDFDYYVNGVSACKPNKPMNKMLKAAEPYTIIGIHNHPKSTVPSIGDIIAAKERKYKYGVVLCHDGRIYKYSVKETYDNDVLAKMRLERLGDAVYNNDEERKQKALSALEDIGIHMEVV